MTQTKIITETPPPPSKFCSSLPTMPRAWDSTTLRTFLECPRKYQYRMIEGWVPKRDKPALVFGLLFHEALELFDRKKHEGLPHVEATFETAKWLLDASHPLGEMVNEETGKPIDNNRTRFSIFRTVIWYIDYYGKEDPIKIVELNDGSPALELSFRLNLPIDSPDGDAYLLCGHMDKIANFAERLQVVERKTTTYNLDDRYFKRFTPDIQISIYDFAGSMVLPEKIDGVLIDAAQCGVTFSRFRRDFAPRKPAQREEFMKDLVRWIASAERCSHEDYWPKDESACGDYGGCMYRGICSRDPSVRRTWLEADFKKEEWNPLENR